MKILFFGNCQIFNLYLSARLAQPNKNGISVDFIDGNLPNAFEILTEQVCNYDKLVFQGRAEFINPPPDFKGPVITLPTVYFKTLWPFDGPDIVVETSTRTDKLVIRGDTKIVELIKSGLTRAEVYDYYLNYDFYENVDFKEYFYDELQNHKNKESYCDIKVGDYIENNFFTDHLFSMAWHPTNKTLYKFFNNDELWDFIGYDENERNISLNFFKGGEVLRPDVPIHPNILKHANTDFGIKTYEINGKTITFEDYLNSYLDIHFNREA